MAVNKDIKVTGIIIRNGKKIKRDELTITEQYRLANQWNTTAMEAAGYTPVSNKPINTSK